MEQNISIPQSVVSRSASLPVQILSVINRLSLSWVECLLSMLHQLKNQRIGDINFTFERFSSFSSAHTKRSLIIRIGKAVSDWIRFEPNPKLYIFDRTQHSSHFTWNFLSHNISYQCPQPYKYPSYSISVGL